jgi:hypothetical protein
MRNFLWSIGLLHFISFLGAQELFVVTDPASNMPAGSINIRLSQSLFKEKFEEGFNYHLMPELSYGINKNLMLRAAGFVSNRSNQLYPEGGSLFVKYRFFSSDDIHSHFRMAAYGRVSKNRADIHQEQIETMGHNSGAELGFIATKLLHKTAISGSISLEKATNNRPDYDFPETQDNTAINYSLSWGRLMYPKTYKSYKQTNINLMFECLGQTLSDNRKTFIDGTAALQFIINSQSRIDLAYRKSLFSNMIRSAPNGIYLNIEYTFFNPGKRRK